MSVKPMEIANFARFLQEHWHEKSGLIASAIITVCGSAWSLHEVNAVWGLPIWGPLLLGALLYVIWRWSNSPPRTKAKRVGFLVSIDCEDDEESQTLKADFLVPLQQLLKSGNAGNSFHFVVLQPHLSKRIVDLEDAELMRRKVRAHFMLFGRVRKRAIDGHLTHFVDLHGIVAHNPMSEAGKRRLEEEFAELLPRRVQIASENDLLAFEFTSEWAALVAKYVIGIAAAVSGDLNYAQRLYADALNTLRTKSNAFPVYRKLFERLPLRLLEIHSARANAVYDKWKSRHSNEDVEELGRHLALIMETGAIIPPNVNYLMALHAFLSNRDIGEALAHLRKVKYMGGALWNLNQAFLLGYKGDLKGAMRHYRAASLDIPEAETISDVEEFICWVLQVEPDKYQLYYCLGVFNWKVKGDGIQARKDFEAFLQKGLASEFQKERELVPCWLRELSNPESSRQD